MSYPFITVLYAKREEMGCMSMNSESSPIRGVVFDLDGTIVDSEENYYQSDVRILARRGVALTREDKGRFIGYGNRYIMERFIAEFGLADTPDALLEEKNREYLAIARSDTSVFPEMRALIEGFFARGVPMAVASGSSPAVIREVLGITGLRRYFGATVSSEEVPNGKPEPDVFLEAAERIRSAPRNTLVVEDAVYGVIAAKRAGMRCAVIPTFPGPPFDSRLLEADYVVPGGMRGFVARDLLRWMGGHDA